MTTTRFQILFLDFENSQETFSILWGSLNIPRSLKGEEVLAQSLIQSTRPTLLRTCENICPDWAASVKFHTANLPSADPLAIDQIKDDKAEIYLCIHPNHYMYHTHTQTTEGGGGMYVRTSVSK